MSTRTKSLGVAAALAAIAIAIPTAVQAYAAGCRMTESETLAGLLAAYDAAA